MTGATVVLAGWIRRTSARQRSLESWSGCHEISCWNRWAFAGERRAMAQRWANPIPIPG